MYMFKYINKKNNDTGFFNLGLAYGIYFSVMFLAIPVIMELASVVLGVNTAEFISGYFLFDKIYTLESWLYALMGLVSFVFGYVIIKKKTIHVPNFYKAIWSYKKIHTLSLTLFVSGFLLKVFKLFKGIPDFYRFEGTIVDNPLLAFFISVNPLHSMSLLIIIIGYYDSKFHNHRKYNKKFLITAVILMSIYVLFSLDQVAKTRLLTPFLIIIIVRHLYYPTSLKKIILIISILFIIVMKVGGIIGSYESRSDVDSSLKGNLRPYIVRVSQIQTLTQVIEHTNIFHYGYTFLNFFEKFKPASMRKTIVDGNEFGRKYYLIGENDMKTGVAYTNIGDFYINFALPGIIFGMFFLGVIYKLLYNFLIHTNMFLILALPPIWFTIIHGVESAISIVFYKLIMLFLILTVLHVILIKYRKKDIEVSVKKSSKRLNHISQISREL
jgi:oligosaccharide repeat unit polymerase